MMPCDEHTSKQIDVFQGIVTNETVSALQKQHKIALSPDQSDCLRMITESTNSLLLIHALAGAGKTLLTSILLECLAPVMAGSKNVVVLLVLGRELRDEVVMNIDNLVA